MALQAWIGRTAGQLDADSPLDITLFNGIDDDLIHLKQVVYGDGAGGFRTAIDGHKHSADGSDSAPLATDSVTHTQMADGAIGSNSLYHALTSTSTSIAANTYYYPSGLFMEGARDVTTNLINMEMYLNSAWIEMWAYATDNVILGIHTGSTLVRFHNQDMGSARVLAYLNNDTR